MNDIAFCPTDTCINLDCERHPSHIDASSQYVLYSEFYDCPFWHLTSAMIANGKIKIPSMDATAEPVEGER